MGDATDVYHFSTETPQRPPRCPADSVARGATVVIDNGSYQCRVGWAGQKEPRLAFRALVHRPKAKVRQPACVAVATPRWLAVWVVTDSDSVTELCRLAASSPQSLPDGPLIVGDYDASLLRGVDASRSLTKTAFDGPVACFMDVQEAVFDHAFDRLGLGGAGVAHPVVCTEPLLAPPSARARLAELLFESYGVPSLAFGADAAFAWAHAAQSFSGGSPGGTGLVACLGHSSSTLLPILNGMPVNAAAVRLEVAGLNVTQYLSDLLRVNFPEFGTALGPGAFGRAEELKHALCHVAADYAAEAAAYAAVARSSIGRGGVENGAHGAGGPPAAGPFPPGRGVRVQLPWVPKTVKPGAQPLTEEDIQRREAHRKASVCVCSVVRVCHAAVDACLTPLFLLLG